MEFVGAARRIPSVFIFVLLVLFVVLLRVFRLMRELVARVVGVLM